METASTTKLCVSCGKTLNGQKRMKDSQGLYWCIECGEKDPQKKLMAAAGSGGNACAACGEMFPAHQLSKFGKEKLCSGCIRNRTKGPGLKATLSGLFSGGGQADTGKLYKLIGVMIVMIILVIWRYATL